MKNINLGFAISKARQEASSLLESIKRNAGEKIDVYAIAKMHNVVIEEKKFQDDIAGFIKRGDDNSPTKIFVNGDNIPERKRFTIAHELGHYILHTQDFLHVDESITVQSIHFRDNESSKATRVKEIEANQFAAELLMPSEEIKKEVIKEMIDNDKSLDDVVIQLANQYEVSRTAMTIKIGSLF